MSTAKHFACSLPEYWSLPENERPDDLDTFIDKYVNRKGGFWHIKVYNKSTGELETEQISENLLTDNGGLAALKGIAGSAITGITPANNIAIDQSWGMTTLATTINASTSTSSITTGALVGSTSIPINSWITINAGQATTFTVQITQAITGAGTYTCATRTSPGSTITASSTTYIRMATPAEIIAAGGTVPVGLSADSASLSGASYAATNSGMASGQFTYANSSGAAGYGNRNVVVATGATYQFSTTGSPAATAGTYTAAWLVNANPVAATTNTFAHIAFDSPVIIGTNSVGQVSITEKL